SDTDWPCLKYPGPMFLTGDSGDAHVVISLSWLCNQETTAHIDLTGVPREIHANTTYDRCE
ncbi:MAG TPA: hypothetical protein VI756_23635, partial [Blastocatellia bacterium]